MNVYVWAGERSMRCKPWRGDAKISWDSDQEVAVITGLSMTQSGDGSRGGRSRSYSKGFEFTIDREVLHKLVSVMVKKGFLKGSVRVRKVAKS